MNFTELNKTIIETKLEDSYKNILFKYLKGNNEQANSIDELILSKIEDEKNYMELVKEKKKQLSVLNNELQNLN